jgi:prevent-host-death family protein
MTPVVNIHEAKTHLSRLIDQVAAGREVIIAKAGRKVARLVPLDDGVRPKKLGGLKGRLKVPDDFNAPLDDSVVAAFEGRSWVEFSSTHTCRCGP